MNARRGVLQRRDVDLSQKLRKPIAPRHRQHRRHRVDLLHTVVSEVGASQMLGGNTAPPSAADSRITAQ